jgi:hypothetical protein
MESKNWWVTQIWNHEHHGGCPLSYGGNFFREWISELSGGNPLRALLGILLILAVIVLAITKVLIDPGSRPKPGKIS